jgi:hypothetical protein
MKFHKDYIQIFGCWSHLENDGSHKEIHIRNIKNHQNSWTPKKKKHLARFELLVVFLALEINLKKNYHETFSSFVHVGNE